MMPRLQMKITGLLTCFVALLLLTNLLISEQGLRNQVRAEATRSLIEQAQLVNAWVQDVPFTPSRRAELEVIASRISRNNELRVHFIGADGSIIADSSRTPEKALSQTRNQLSRPEIIAALSGSPAPVIQNGGLLEDDQLVIAVPTEGKAGDAPRGFIRLTKSLSQIDPALSVMRAQLWKSAGIALFLSTIIIYVLTLIGLRSVRELKEVVSDLSEGHPDRALTWETGDERKEIAQAVNRLAQFERSRIIETEDERGRLEAVLTSMAEGVLVLDADDKVILANPPLREMFSLWGDIINRPIQELIRTRAVTDGLNEVDQSDHVQVHELRISKPQEAIFSMHMAGFPREGPRNGTVIVFHDVTEMRRLDQVRQDFVANASHELRTPLTSIQGFADTLASTTDLGIEKTRDYLAVISRNAQRMSNLIDDLMTLSRIESGRESLSPVMLDVSRVIRTLLEDFGPQFARAELKLEFHDTQEPVQALADPRALEQILLNLLTNSIRYTDPGGSVEIKINKAVEDVSIEVLDTGIGIPKEDLERVFERFYRVDKSRSRALGSTGLGLAIVRHLVNSMGGQIDLQSEVGQGTAVTITLAGSDVENTA